MLIDRLIDGGPLMIPLVICSLVSLAVVYDRWSAFRANRKTDTRALRANVLARLAEDDVDAAIKECETARGPLPSVLLAGLRSYQQLREKGEQAETMRMVVMQVMEDYAAQAMSVVNKRLDVLTTIATAAPLLGMTGTVTGMIVSFSGMEKSGFSDSGGDVARGIAEALTTTAVGLIIALSAVIPQSVFNRWSDEIELEIEESATELIEHILTHH
jgi:biopolymer transport protein ExbB